MPPSPGGLPRSHVQPPPFGQATAHHRRRPRRLLQQGPGVTRQKASPLLRPEARINPIHGADLAQLCVDRLMAGQEGAWSAEWPQVLTWRGLAPSAPWGGRRRSAPSRSPSCRPHRGPGARSPGRADTLRLVAWSMLHGCVGGPVGTRRLPSFYARHAAGARARTGRRLLEGCRLRRVRRVAGPADGVRASCAWAGPGRARRRSRSPGRQPPRRRRRRVRPRAPRSRP